MYYTFDTFGKAERQFFTTDTVHPSDYGFHKMAKKTEPVFCEILKIIN